MFDVAGTPAEQGNTERKPGFEPSAVTDSATAAAAAGTFAAATERRIVQPAPIGEPTPPVPSRVSTRRRGVTGSKLGSGAATTGVPLGIGAHVCDATPAADTACTGATVATAVTTHAHEISNRDDIAER